MKADAVDAVKSNVRAQENFISSGRFVALLQTTFVI